MYAREGIVVNLIFIDKDLKKLEGVIENNDGIVGNVVINTNAACGHVGEIKRCIHITKEHV